MLSSLCSKRQRALSLVGLFRCSRVSRWLHSCLLTLGLGRTARVLKRDFEAWPGEYYTDSDGSEVALPDAEKEALAKTL